MSKKNGTSKNHGILLDSIYLLPIFGVQVKGVSSEDLLRLRDLAINNKIKIHYSPISLVEIVSKIAREANKNRKAPGPREVEATIEIIEKSHYLYQVHPDSKAYALAYEIKLLGHKDIMDNLLYATATVNNLYFITMDYKLRDFIQRHKIQGAKILTHKDLLKEY